MKFCFYIFVVLLSQIIRIGFQNGSRSSLWIFKIRISEQLIWSWGPFGVTTKFGGNQSNGCANIAIFSNFKMAPAYKITDSRTTAALHGTMQQLASV